MTLECDTLVFYSLKTISSKLGKNWDIAASFILQDGEKETQGV